MVRVKLSRTTVQVKVCVPIRLSTVRPRVIQQLRTALAAAPLEKLRTPVDDDVLKPRLSPYRVWRYFHDPAKPEAWKQCLNAFQVRKQRDQYSDQAVIVEVAWRNMKCLRKGVLPGPIRNSVQGLWRDETVDEVEERACYFLLALLH